MAVPALQTCVDEAQEELGEAEVALSELPMLHVMYEPRDEARHYSGATASRLSSLNALWTFSGSATHCNGVYSVSVH